MGFVNSAALTTTAKSAASQVLVGTIRQDNTCMECSFLANFLFRDLTVWVSEREDELSVLMTYELQQNYPNTFNPSTRITFALPKPTQVTLKIFDGGGREVTTLAQGRFPAGWQQGDQGSGAVLPRCGFYRLQAGDFSQTQRLMLGK